MIKKGWLIFVVFVTTIVFELFFYNQMDEIKIPLFLTVMLLLVFLLIKSGKIFIPKVFSFLFLLFIATNLISFTYAVEKFSALLEMIKLFSLGSLIILGVNLFKKKENFQLFFFTFTIFSAFLALIGIVEYTTRTTFQKNLSLFEPFNWPSLAASFFLLTLPPALILFLQETKPFKKIVLFICLTFLTVAWILSREYLWLIFLLFISTLFFNFLFQKKSIRNMLIFFLLLFTCLPNLLSSFGSNRIPREIALYQDKYYFFDRDDASRFSLTSIKKHLISGIGPGNFGPVYRQNQAKAWTWSDYAGNELLQTFVEAGLPGFVAELFLFIYLFFLFIKKFLAAYKDKDLFDTSIVLSAFFFLAESLVNFSFRNFPLQIIFFLVISYLLINEKIIVLSRNLIKLFLIPLILFSLFLFSDGILLRFSQRYFVEKNYKKSAPVLNWLSKRPDFLLNPKTLIWLSAFYVERNEDTKAYQLLERARFLQSTFSEIDYQLAFLSYKKGDLVKTQEILKNKIDINPYQPPKFYFTLSKLAEEQKNLPRSQYWLLRASIFYPFLDRSKTNQNLLSVLQYNDYLSYLTDIYYSLYRLTNQQKYINTLSSLIY